jgi:hypothetical protein
LPRSPLARSRFDRGLAAALKLDPVRTISGG